MLYVIYNKKTTNILKAYSSHIVESYKSMPAAKAALTRMAKKGELGYSTVYIPTLAPNGMSSDKAMHTALVKEDFNIIDAETFATEIEQQVQRKNLMTGKMYTEAKNTPNSCSPASETYWCM
jgi:hypothetical protein